MKNLSEFFHSFDFVRSRPLSNWLQGKPAGTVESVWESTERSTSSTSQMLEK